MNRRRWMIGRLWRWFRARGPAYRIAVSAVAAVLLLEVVGLAAWWIFGNWRLGRVVLTSDAAPLKVQVLGESGDEPIGEPVDVNPTATLSLPAGDYRLRVTGTGRLSRTYRMAVNRGETLAHALNLDTGRLLGEEPGPEPRYTAPARTRPIPYTPTTTAVELTPGKADLVEWTPGSIVRRDGVTGEAFWDALSVSDPAGSPERPPPLAALARPSPRVRQARPAGAGPQRRRHGRPRLDLPARDRLPGRLGEGRVGPVDLRRRARRPRGCLSRRSALARTGQPDRPVGLCHRRARGGGPRRRRPARPHRHDRLRRAPRGDRATVAGDDGGADRAACPASPAGSSWRSRDGRGRGSGATRSIPRSDAAARRRLAGRRSCRAGRRRPWASRTARPGWASTRRPAGRGPVRSTWASSRSGPSSTPTSTATASPRSSPWVPGTPRRKLTAFSIATGRPLWTATIDSTYGGPFDEPLDDAWPMIADLDGDGRSEIVVPDSGALDARNGYHGVRVLDGPTGRPRWTRPMRPATGTDDWLASILAAPDLDHDGVRDILTISSYEFLPVSRPGSTGQARSYVRRCALRQGRPAALVVALRGPGRINTITSHPRAGGAGVRTAGRSWP